MTLLALSVDALAFDDGDFQYWNSAQAALELNKDWEVKFEEEIKFGDDAGEF